MAVNYRDAYKLHASNGILFNHESPRRGEIFVTRKITRAIASILSGKQARLFLGNLDARRDWGFAPEYVEAMWKILQHDTADDYVIGTGVSHSVRDFLEAAMEYIGLELEWKGNGTGEKGIVKSRDSKWKDATKSGATLVEIDPRYYRPTEVDALQADASKARKILGWEPKVTFNELVQVMMDYDLLAVGIKPPGKGISAVNGKGFTWTKHEFSKHERIKE